jgi:NTE family protein
MMKSKDQENGKKHDPPTTRITTQNALVLQGGGALAAYEVGVYGVLYFWIKKDLDGGDDNNNKNIFDVIAGTSGGAINAAIIISHVQQRRKKKLSIQESWQGSFRKLLDFWNFTSSSPDFTVWRPFFSLLWPLNRDERSWISVWDKDQKNNESSSTGEAARRYYSTKEYLYRGAPGVFSIPSLEYDNKFMDNFFNPTNIWPHYSNEELKKSIEKYTEFPIATETKNQQPRLLVISTDVREGEAVTFDSYQKPDGSRSSEYGDYVRGGKREMKIRYDDGSMTEHIMASSSVPVHYNYTLVPENYSNKSGNGVREFGMEEY